MIVILSEAKENQGKVISRSPRRLESRRSL
jgi:hypothetical protein